MRTLFATWKYITFISMYVQITANSIIFLDLYLTLNNPFHPRHKRVKWYFGMVTILYIAIIATFTKALTQQGTSLELYDASNNQGFIQLLKTYTIILTLSTLIPVGMVAYRLSKQGTSRDLKKKVLYRHIIYFILYVAMLVHIYYD